ncbi:chondroitin proteoglycan 2-like, partial [Stegodyphus dumicola]|uniref:chondroitin proteoglycan 2-like n=1 Tax=Stegodyphus dumicola TaxID=202533 RepID=UPI0015AC7437
MVKLLRLVIASAFVWCSHGLRLDFPQNLFANWFQKNNITADFKCIKDGLYRNSESCEHYIQCSKGIPYERSCSKGLHFSIKTHSCEAPCDAHCDQIYAEECGWKYSVRNVPDDFECIKDGLYKNSYGCDNYIQCSDGLAFEQSCPFGLHFNEDTERCEMPCDAHCDESIGEECGWVESNFTSNHATLVPVELRCYEDGIYENHQDCGRYIVCSSGVAHEESCPEGLHFNSEKKICEDPCDAHCDSTIWEQCGWPTPREWCGRQALDGSIPEDFRCSSDGIYQNNGSCDTYIHCSNGMPYKQQCPKGLHFGPKIQRCELPCIAHCDKNLAEECGWNKNLEEYEWESISNAEMADMADTTFD